MKLFYFLALHTVLLSPLYPTSIFDYYIDELQAHKEQFRKILSETHTESKDYPLNRILLCVECEDADLIPKCENAGKIVCSSEESYQIMHNGIRVLLDGYCGSWMTDLIYGLKGHHEPQEEKIFHEVLKYIPPQSTMIELGANWAYYSLWFAKMVPGSINYLIEPSEQNLKTGMKNFELNMKQGRFIRGYAAIRDNDSIDFNGARKIIIDSFLEEENIEHLNILHSDIQGAEYEMLLSCEESIQKGKIDYFFISTHSNDLHNQCLSYLKNQGLFVIAEHSHSESYSFDGLIVARRAELPGPDPIRISKAH